MSTVIDMTTRAVDTTTTVADPPVLALLDMKGIITMLHLHPDIMNIKTNPKSQPH